MRVSSRFTIAVHILAYIALNQDKEKVISGIMAGSINVNPVVVRRLLSTLSKAGLIGVKRGSGGAYLVKKSEEITLLDVYKAVESTAKDGIFHFHKNPNPQCPVGREIHHGLDDKLIKVQEAMENELAAITLADVVGDMHI